LALQIIADAIVSAPLSSAITQEIKILLQQPESDTKKLVQNFFSTYSVFKQGEQVSPWAETP
jgi:hypothetical protein